MSRTHTHHPDHDHDHDDHHDHDQPHKHGVIGWLQTLVHLHNHSHQQPSLAADPAFAHTNAGIRTVWIALGLLLFTSILPAGPAVPPGRCWRWSRRMNPA